MEPAVAGGDAARTPRRAALSEIALATAAMISSNAVQVGIAALIPLVRHDLPLNAVTIGAAAATPSAAATVSVPFAPAMIARWGAGATVGISQLVCGGAAIVCATAPDLAVFFAGIALFGIGFGIVSPASNILSMGLISPRHRGLAMSVKQTGVTLGGAAAGLTLPALATATSWRFALWLPAAAALAVALWGFATRAHGSRKPLVLAERAVAVHRFRFGLYGFVMSGVQLAFFGYATVYLVDHVGFSPSRAGVGFAVALTFGTLGRLGWGVVSDHVRDRLRILHVVAGGSVVVLTLLPFASPLTVWPLLAWLGFCAVGWNGVYNTVIAESAGALGVARMTGYIMPFMFVGAIVIPPVLGLVVDLGSWTWFWWVAAATTAVAACGRFGAREPEVALEPAGRPSQ